MEQIRKEEEQIKIEDNDIYQNNCLNDLNCSPNDFVLCSRAPPHVKKCSSPIELCSSQYDFREFVKINIDEKTKIMEMIKTQDFINGYWEENKYTKIVKDIYQEEYNLLKGLKDKNIDDKTALTILIIYFLNEQYPYFLSDFLMIIKKARIFIQKQTNDIYENIIKDINLN